jgi:hypothetical protein
MAVIFRNPMPRTGALFVTNPRRNSRRKTNRRRRANTFLRRNKSADAGHGKILSGPKKGAWAQIPALIGFTKRQMTLKEIANYNKQRELTAIFEEDVIVTAPSGAKKTGKGKGKKKETAAQKEKRLKKARAKRAAKKKEDETAEEKTERLKKSRAKSYTKARTDLREAGIEGYTSLPKSWVGKAATLLRKKQKDGGTPRITSGSHEGLSLTQLVNLAKKEKSTKRRKWPKSSDKAGKSRASVLRSKFNRIVGGLYLDSTIKTDLYKVYKKKYLTLPIDSALGLKTMKAKLVKEARKLEKAAGGYDLGESELKKARAKRQKTLKDYRVLAKDAGIKAYTRLTASRLKGLLSDSKTKTSAEKIATYNKSHAKKLAEGRKGFYEKARGILRGEGGDYAQFLNNPWKIFKRFRKNQGIGGIQPLAMGLEGTDYVQKQVSKVPVVRLASFAITPIAVGFVTYHVSKMLEPKLMEMLDKSGVDRIPVLNKVLVYPYTTTGVATGIALGTLAKFKLINKQAASIIATAAASIGIALDLSLRSFAKAATDVASEEIAEASATAQVAAAQAIEQVDPAAAAAMAANGNMGAIAYGDGGAYMLGANTQALGKLSEYQGIAMEYQDASAADAHYCNCHMLPDEVSAAKAGPSFYLLKFGRSPHRKKGQRTMVSRHAGRAGHRFGWLIKMFGYRNFQKLASLSTSQRTAVLMQLRKQALDTLPHLVQQYKAENASIETASIPIHGASNGQGGSQGLGYGALMYAGSNY